jgi:hypothetical protein
MQTDLYLQDNIITIDPAQDTPGRPRSSFISIVERADNLEAKSQEKGREKPQSTEDTKEALKAVFADLADSMSIDKYLAEHLPPAAAQHQETKPKEDIDELIARLKREHHTD